MSGGRRLYWTGTAEIRTSEDATRSSLLQSAHALVDALTAGRVRVCMPDPTDYSKTANVAGFVGLPFLPLPPLPKSRRSQRAQEANLVSFEKLQTDSDTMRRLRDTSRIMGRNLMVKFLTKDDSNSANGALSFI